MIKLELTTKQAACLIVTIYTQKRKSETQLERHRKLMAEPETIAIIEFNNNSLGDLIAAIQPHIDAQLGENFCETVFTELELKENLNQL
jgi:hypothetical protein